MRDNIWDATTGRHLAWIENEEVFDAQTAKKVGTVRDGHLYSLDGELVGHLESTWQVHTGKAPDAFLKLLRSA